MDVAVRLTDLPALHPRLLWEEMAAAAVAMLSRSGATAPFLNDFSIENLPGFGSDFLQLAIDAAGVSSAQVTRVQRTHEVPRLAELAAIAIAGLGLSHAGRHEIRDVALRGTAADYLVDESNHLLEIAGRSRRKDFGSAWRQRHRRLTNREGRGFYLCVVEFQTPAGRLAFLS